MGSEMCIRDRWVDRGFAQFNYRETSILQGARELAVQVVQESDAVSRSRAMIWQALTSDDAKRRSHDRRT